MIRRNDKWLYVTSWKLPTVVYTKFMSSVMVLGVVSNEIYVMQPYLFPQGFRVNVTTFIKMTDMVVKTSIKGLAIHVLPELYFLSY